MERTYVKPKRPNNIFWGIKKDFFKIRKNLGINARLSINAFKQNKIALKRFYKSLLRNHKFKSIFNITDFQLKKTKSRRSIEFLKKINCYRGRRHTSFLSVRGQRTKTNCKTQRYKKNKKLNKSLNAKRGAVRKRLSGD